MIFAVQNGGFHPSASGGVNHRPLTPYTFSSLRIPYFFFSCRAIFILMQNHSIVLSHVTDRMMQGLAKRHEAGARPPPPIDSTPLRSGNYQRNTGHQLDHSSVSSYGPGSAQSSRASTPAVATPAGSGMYGNALAGGVAGDRWMSQPLASQTPSSRLRGHENPPPSAQSGALSSVPYGASPYNNYLQQSQPPQYSATPYSIYPPQQQQSMPQQQHTPGNYSQMPPRSGHAQPLRIDAGGAYSDEDEEEKGNALSEEVSTQYLPSCCCFVSK